MIVNNLVSGAKSSLIKCGRMRNVHFVFVRYDAVTARVLLNFLSKSEPTIKSGCSTERRAEREAGVVTCPCGEWV